MLRSLWNRAVVHLMDEPVPTSDEVSDSSPTSPLGSPSAGPRTNLTAALQVPLVARNPSRMSQLVIQLASAHPTRKLHVQSPAGESLAIGEELQKLFAWLAVFFAAEVESCRQGDSTFVASAKARLIAHGAIGTTGSFGDTDLSDDKTKRFGKIRRVISEPVRGLRRQLKAMTRAAIAEVDPATLYCLLLPTQADLLCRAGVLKHAVLEATPAFEDLVRTTPFRAPKPCALPIPTLRMHTPPWAGTCN